ncbi:uncharacterized protein N0V89_008251 [Didymosphaeria variabile]|uniref:Xaa-Pro dipeptidyl-peptidase C-terminal domain-containing protein n=1 Tax=Didymosphaeria variabile TaxID=1932322 RepID=A0A9W8XH84_9PLEO|nr:uncharacterized protein N0V89_008251 [Didymosphaeria variabile]KAJ4349634.1 hypothetical protein N0V89_008251 [Didymosphaeria variabile]
MTPTESEYTVGTIEVFHTSSSKANDPRAKYNGTINLPIGHKREPDCRSFESETIFDKDIVIPMRDGTVLRGDGSVQLENRDFQRSCSPHMGSDNEREDIIAMIKKYPLVNDYWQDKRAQSHLIQCPAYVLASMATSLHLFGSIRGFEQIPHDKKWLRLHPTQEWHDLYQPESVTDFKKFLDFYMKDLDNKRTSPRSNPPRWDANPEELNFTLTFPERSALIGPVKAVLFMSCPNHDDMDVFIILRKADAEGKVLRNINIPIPDLHAVDPGIPEEKDVEMVNTHQYIGPMGVLRASHRKHDESLSTEN